MVIDAVAGMARQLRTPISEIENMEWDRFEAYSKALGRILKAEAKHSARSDR